MYKIDVDDYESSLISEISYDREKMLLKICFRKYYVDSLTFIDVPFRTFVEFSHCKSYGRFYLNNIKQHFKQLKINTMADRPKGINKSNKDGKRFIKGSINVKKINKDWLHVGRDGNIYLNFTLHMMPDGTVDQYENLGFMTQDVPKAIYSEDKNAKGEILGNMAEFEYKAEVASPGQETGKLASDEEFDDLPF